MAQHTRIEDAVAKIREQLEIIAEETRLLLIERQSLPDRGISKKLVWEYFDEWGDSEQLDDSRQPVEVCCDLLHRHGLLIEDGQEEYDGQSI